MADDLTKSILRAEKGAVLFREGEAGDCMYFILSGKIRIEKAMPGGSEPLAYLEEGDFFGEMALLDQTSRTATAVVEEPAELWRIDGTNFEKLLRTNVEIAVRMIRKYSSRLRETNAKLESILKDRNDIARGIEEIIQSAKTPPARGPQGEKGPPPLAELFHRDSGEVFQVTKERSTVGRLDPATNIVPDIDLAGVDVERRVSRRHARLEWIDGQFFLTEEPGVANGTYSGPTKLKPGVPTRLEDDGRVRFGNVEFRFVLKTTP
ncbi:MAG: cyclic nucleotide-binding domain-containing protein [Pseudomonadota bacterium]